MPDDARYILERCPGLHGFYGASSMERLPAEAAIREPDGEISRRCRPASQNAIAPRRQAHERPNKMFVYPKDVDAFGFDWGRLALTVAPEVNGAARFSGGVVDLPPGQGHARHNHPGAEEIIFVISGNGEQMVEDETGNPITQKVGPGCTIYVPESRFHSTLNTGDGADAALRRLFAGRPGTGSSRPAGLQDHSGRQLGSTRPRCSRSTKIAGPKSWQSGRRLATRRL